MLPKFILILPKVILFISILILLISIVRIFIEHISSKYHENDIDDNIFFDNAPLPDNPPSFPPSSSSVELTPDQIRLKEFMKQREERIKNEERVGVLRE